MNWLEKIFGEWVVRYRWLIIGATLIAVTISALVAQHLTFSTDTRIFFSEENPQLQALEALENTYSKIDNVLFAIAPKDGKVFTRSTLTAIEELTEASWQIPYSSRVDSLTNFQHTRAEDDDLIVEDLVRNSAELSDEDIAEIKTIALAEPYLLNNLISPSSDVTGIVINLILPGESLAEVPEVATFSRSLAEDFRKKHPELDIHLSGGTMLNNAFGEAGKNDMSFLVPMMFLTLVVIVGLSLRSFIGTLSTVIIIFLSTVTAMGLAGWFGITLSAASVNAPTIILTLAVADSVHILVAILHHLKLGKTRHEAITESLRINLQPVFLTSITTAIGFLSMNFSDAPPFRDLGNIVAMGVTSAFFYSVIFLPALLAVLPLKTHLNPKNSDCSSCDKLADLVIKHRQSFFWGMGALVIAITLGIFRIELNDQFVKYFTERYDIRRATDYVEENLRGWDIIEYSLDSGEPGGINDPGYLAQVEAFANWYRKQPKVVHVTSITDTMKRLNKNMHGDDETYYTIPDQRDLAAQYLLLYEMSLPFGRDLNNQINVDKSATRLVISLKGTNTKEQREMDTVARQWLKQNAPSMFTYGSGISIIWAHISERNINSMLKATFIALLLISGILVFALKSFRIGVLSLIPNIAPAFMAFGVWGLLVGQVGLGLTVVASMTMGIVVDDTVHFLSKYLRARREYKMDPAQAVRYSYHTVGTALWVTTLALVAGFSVLAFSDYKMNADMGIMSAITISLALALDFLFLPVLLMKTDKYAHVTDNEEKIT